MILTVHGKHPSTPPYKWSMWSVSALRRASGIDELSTHILGDGVQQRESMNPLKCFKVFVSLLSSLAVFLAQDQPYFHTS